MKNRVTGIGGIFFKTKDPDNTKEWYENHLGLNTDNYGCTFWWQNEKGEKCSTQWSLLRLIPTIFRQVKRNS